MDTVTIRNPGMAWDIAANIHYPPDFDSAIRYPAVVSNHPIGSCKEQTAGDVYGAAMAKAGFVVIVPDAGTQGGSGGEPRWTEDPEQRVRDYRDVIDYLQTLTYVDPQRIGILGICGGGVDQGRDHRQADQGAGEHYGREFWPPVPRGVQPVRSGWCPRGYGGPAHCGEFRGSVQGRRFSPSKRGGRQGGRDH